MLTTKGGTPDFDLLAPLSTDADVLNRVDQIIGYDARRRRSMWLLFLDPDGVQLPVIVPIDDFPAEPEADGALSICHLIAHVLEDAAPGGSAVITLVRGDGRALIGSDRHWLLALQDAAARADARLRMICLATADGIRQLEPPAPPS